MLRRLPCSADSLVWTCTALRCMMALCLGGCQPDWCATEPLCIMKISMTRSRSLQNSATVALEMKAVMWMLAGAVHSEAYRGRETSSEYNARCMPDLNLSNTARVGKGFDVLGLLQEVVMQRPRAKEDKMLRCSRPHQQLGHHFLVP